MKTPNKKTTTSTWQAQTNLLSTRVAGVLTLDEVRRWKEGLEQMARRISKDETFRMLVDIRGYEVADQEREVHQAMREVVPLFLAAHGFRMGFFDLYEEEPPVGRGETSARCVAVAHVHHDAGKMERYNELLARPAERFFTDADEAERWLREAETA